jgi:AcrR family transcriptional regulator
MARPTQQQVLARGAVDMAAEIKATARAQMAAQGTAGLTLRGIARALGITAPAIYNYYPRLDDLITALIVDAFTDLAEAMEAAEAAEPSPRACDKILALCLAYRQWAMAHPTDFQLIGGNPIPGYHAPEEVTIPLARRPFLGMFHWFIRAHASGELSIPADYQAVPPAVAAGVAAWRQLSGIDVPDPLMGLLMSGWARIYGLTALELYGHLQPLVGDPAALYRYEMAALLGQLGLASGKHLEKES